MVVPISAVLHPIVPPSVIGIVEVMNYPEEERKMNTIAANPKGGDRHLVCTEDINRDLLNCFTY